RLAGERGSPDGPVEAPRLQDPLLIVAGSAHPVTLAQVARLRARGLDNRWVLSPERAGVVDDPDRRAETARRLGALALARVGEAPRPGSVLLTGGESAAAVCRALGATGLRLDGEAEPGLARGRLLDGPCAGLAVVTKAGGFGDPDTLVRLWEAC